MRIEKSGSIVTSLEDWRRVAGPKNPAHWVIGRSAFELAYSWLGTGTPAMPSELRALLDTCDETGGLVVETVYPEHRIAFDGREGEPRNADIAFAGTVGSRTVAVTVEAKADESFGATVADTLCAALERGLSNERSGGVARVQDLARAILPAASKGLPSLGRLRYQLLTAVAGSVAFAVQNNADVGVLVVHEFVTDQTSRIRQERNSSDYSKFIHRLSGHLPASTAELLGPFSVPGKPLFPKAPPIYVGKVTTVRLLGA